MYALNVIVAILLFVLLQIRPNTDGSLFEYVKNMALQLSKEVTYSNVILTYSKLACMNDFDTGTQLVKCKSYQINTKKITWLNNLIKILIHFTYPNWTLGQCVLYNIGTILYLVLFNYAYLLPVRGNYSLFYCFRAEWFICTNLICVITELYINCWRIFYIWQKFA